MRMSDSTDDALDVKAISERYFETWMKRDPDAIVALHAEDSQFRTRLGMEPITGREAIRETFADLFERFPEFSFETYRVLYGADFWILDWALIFKPEGSDRTERFDCLDVVNLSPEGLVARKETFVDMVQMQAAIPQISEQIAEATAGAEVAA
jgi:ketosteroid isomerase-like protein